MIHIILPACAGGFFRRPRRRQHRPVRKCTL